MTKLLGKEGKVYGMVSNNSTSRNKNGGTSHPYVGIGVHSVTQPIHHAPDTPLHYAALYGKPEVVKWLLEHHASVNNQNAFGDTPLHCAVSRGDFDIVQLLIRSGASKNLAGRSGTPKEVQLSSIHRRVVRRSTDSSGDVQIAVKEHPGNDALISLL